MLSTASFFFLVTISYYVIKDVFFKKIFGDHPQLLMSFLNAVLPLPPLAPIVSLTYLQSEQVPAIPTFKRTIADVKCRDAAGRVFIVEMQVNWTDHFKNRLLFGTSQAYVKQLEKGEGYTLLQPVYGLGLVADIYEKNTSQWHHHCHIVKKGDREHSDLIDHLQLIFIELPKFPVHSSEEKKLQVLWLRFLREINEKTTTIANELLAVPEIAKAIQLTQEAAFTPDELTLYESYWDQVSREKTLILDKYLEGMVAGKAEGFKEAETKVQQYLVKRLIKLKKTDEEIREITELSFQELMEIKQQIGISSARKEHKIKLLE